jgi:hypothetical protein
MGYKNDIVFSTCIDKNIKLSIDPEMLRLQLAQIK